MHNLHILLTKKNKITKYTVVLNNHNANTGSNRWNSIPFWWKHVELLFQKIGYCILPKSSVCYRLGLQSITAAQARHMVEVSSNITGYTGWAKLSDTTLHFCL